MIPLPPIRDVWRALGGGDITRGQRARAFWRGGDGWSIALDAEQGFFYDHARGEGGGALQLVEIALGVDRAGAWRWLEREFGVRRELPSGAERRAFAAKRARAEEGGEALRFMAWRAWRVNSCHRDAAAWSERLWAWAEDGGPLATDGMVTAGEALERIYAALGEFEARALDDHVAEFRSTPEAKYAGELEWLRFAFDAIDAMAAHDDAQRRGQR